MEPAAVGGQQAPAVGGEQVPEQVLVANPAVDREQAADDGEQAAVGGGRTGPVVTTPLWNPHWCHVEIKHFRSIVQWSSLLAWAQGNLVIHLRKAVGAHTTTALQPNTAIGPSGISLTDRGIDTFVPAPAVGGASEGYGFIQVGLPSAFVIWGPLGLKYISPDGEGTQ